ncbi:hypothetical protein D9M71_620850 [compost metagenome]
MVMTEMSAKMQVLVERENTLSGVVDSAVRNTVCNDPLVARAIGLTFHSTPPVPAMATVPLPENAFTLRVMA